MVILGAGGHAKVVIDILRLAGQVDIAGILSAGTSGKSGRLLGIPIVGDDDELPALSAAGVTHFVVGFSGIGPGPGRQAAHARALTAGLKPLTVIHPAAVVSPHADLGEGVQVFPGAVVNAGAKLDEGVIVNTGAIVEHDCEIGTFAHVASGARLSGVCGWTPGPSSERALR